MKKINKRISILFFLFVFCFMLTACADKEVSVEPEKPAASTEPSEPTKQEETKQEEPKREEEPKEPEKSEKQGKSITIYSINDESLESEQTKVQLKGEVTAEVIVDSVVEAFADHSLEIGIDFVKQEGSNVIVSFLYDKAPLSQVGSTVEETILNSIADSLIDNLPECKGVIFQAEGEAYESGHFAFEKDELYVKE